MRYARPLVVSSEKKRSVSDVEHLRMVDYGPSWPRIRKEQIEKADGECESCGRHKDDDDTAIHVHHLTPAQAFDNVEDAHFDENLMVLCSRCHGRVESGYLPDSEPDIRDDIGMY
jgi:5-methylcytosine-specific restriction endonuclease McrA